MTYREIYEKALNDLELNKITLEEFEERVKPLNQEATSAIEELEKKKANMENLKSSFLDMLTNNDIIAINKDIEIIDNHIKQLKGENK